MASAYIGDVEFWGDTADRRVKEIHVNLTDFVDPERVPDTQARLAEAFALVRDALLERLGTPSSQSFGELASIEWSSPKMILSAQISYGCIQLFLCNPRYRAFRAEAKRLENYEIE
ncbi:DUF6301 family protein [Nocardia sp. CDC153]|nr:DUF6301 family protein [Nocardia sp. CDC153]MEC3956569.1 DUF6301 family protein [Nocardia sp. CDC153]